MLWINIKIRKYSAKLSIYAEQKNNVIFQIQLGKNFCQLMLTNEGLGNAGLKNFKFLTKFISNEVYKKYLELKRK